MGHTTRISDYELERGDGPEPCEGYDIEAEVKAKKVEPEDDKKPVTSTRAKTKAK
ncbi:MAG: hypothetical protein ACXVGR_12600 [Mycobacteriaceae bacterium]